MAKHKSFNWKDFKKCICVDNPDFNRRLKSSIYHLVRELQYLYGISDGAVFINDNDIEMVQREILKVNPRSKWSKYHYTCGYLILTFGCFSGVEPKHLFSLSRELVFWRKYGDRNMLMVEVAKEHLRAQIEQGRMADECYCGATEGYGRLSKVR
jgi:hypothetical protein